MLRDIKNIDKYQLVKVENLKGFFGKLLVLTDRNLEWMSERKISRKVFFNLSGLAMMAGLALLWKRMIEQTESATSKNNIIRVKNDLREGVTFFNDFYILKQENSMKAFSCICTHAGCLIVKEENGLIICPCHGSVFESSTGEVVKGPAFKPLKQYSCIRDNQANEWIVNLSE